MLLWNILMPSVLCVLSLSIDKDKTLSIDKVKFNEILEYFVKYSNISCNDLYQDFIIMHVWYFVSRN